MYLSIKFVYLICCYPLPTCVCVELQIIKIEHHFSKCFQNYLFIIIPTIYLSICLSKCSVNIILPYSFSGKIFTPLNNIQKKIFSVDLFFILFVYYLDIFIFLVRPLTLNPPPPPRPKGFDFFFFLNISKKHES